MVDQINEHWEPEVDEDGYFFEESLVELKQHLDVAIRSKRDSCEVLREVLRAAAATGRASVVEGAYEVRNEQRRMLCYSTIGWSGNEAFIGSIQRSVQYLLHLQR